MKIVEAYGLMFGVPDWVRWLAVDSGGELFGYGIEPSVHYDNLSGNAPFEFAYNDIEQNSGEGYWEVINETLDGELIDINFEDDTDWKDTLIFLDEHEYTSIPNFEKL